MNRIPTSSERELRELLSELVLELYGLDTTPPTKGPEPVIRQKRSPTASGFSRATFSQGTAPSPGRFQSEGSALPGRKRPYVGSSVSTRSAKSRTPVGTSPTGRLPGESDADYIERRKRIRRAQAAGYAPPRSDEVHAKRNPNKMYWEMGH